MGQEIEHKYLVKNDSYKELASMCTHIMQGYLCRDPERTVRVRLSGTKAYITVKGKNHGAARAEFEYEIPIEDAHRMMDLCLPGVLDKTRYYIPAGTHTWEVDEFHGEHIGLVTAEIELHSIDEDYDLPDFVGENVTGDPRYYNSNL